MNFNKTKKNVLDEDQYLEDLEYIIKRDFFPDSELIELQLKYYDALETQDFVAIKEIQLKLNKINQSFDSSTASIEDTPASTSSNKPYKNPNVREERDLHLDQYLSRNTSEDNYSFTQLQQKTVDRQLKRLAGAFKAAKEYNEERYKALQTVSDVKAIEYTKDGVTNSAPDLSTFMEYKVFNPVFFNPESAPLSKEEQIALAGKKSEVVYENIRFKTPLFNVKKTTKNNKSSLYKIPGKIGPDGKEIYDGSSPRIGGFSILGGGVTPYNMTPATTWGEIEGSPHSLPDCPKSQFKMQAPSQREQIGIELASKSGRGSSSKENKQRALQRVRSSLSRVGSSQRLTPSGTRLLSRMTPYTPALINRPGSSVLSHSRMRKATPTPTGIHSITDNLLDI